MRLDSDSDEHEKTLAGVVASFMPYIRRKAARTVRAGLEVDDLIQEGLIGLFGAIKTYSENNTASFNTYAVTCIDNSIYSALRQSARKKDIPLNMSQPLENELEQPSKAHSPEEIAIIREEYQHLITRINRNLSRFERDVLALHLDGYSYIAMAELLGTTEKSVDNALQRARQKLKPQ